VILQRLAEHYDRLVSQGVDLPRPGYSRQLVSFCIVLEPDGALNSFEDLRQRQGTSVRARAFLLPGQGKPPGSGLNPCFLWDNAEYLLGFTNDPAKAARTRRAFEAFRSAHLRKEPGIPHPAYRAVCSFLRNWAPDEVQKYAAELTEKAMNFGLFRLAGDPQFVHELISLPVANSVQPTREESAMCLVSGKYGPCARLHEPKIKGVTGAQSMGALLVSFNASSFASYGKEQSYNAPVSLAATFKYANALNSLLDRRDRRIALGDATVVYWADHPTPLEDVLSGIFGGPAGEQEEDQQRLEKARDLVGRLKSGTPYRIAERESKPIRFFILGLSPNASRLSVRLWIEEDAAVLEQKLAQHLHDLALAGHDDRPLPVWRLVAATGRAEWHPDGRFKRYATEGISPQLAGDLARAVLTGDAYPQSLLATMVRRIGSDHLVDHPRVSAVKACLLRNTRLRGAPVKVSATLDPQQIDIAYRCGRLFALLEKAQIDNLGQIRSTIKERYFASASAMPALIFPRLLRLNHHHLLRLGRGRIFYKRQMDAIMTAPFEFPRHLSMEQQGRFIVGYFQQRQGTLHQKEPNPVEEPIPE
jgi:CRISPR-associated protein Csd1